MLLSLSLCSLEASTWIVFLFSKELPFAYVCGECMCVLHVHVVQLHTSMRWHIEARTGSQVSFSNHLHFIGLRQGRSLNWKLVLVRLAGRPVSSVSSVSYTWLTGMCNHGQIFVRVLVIWTQVLRLSPQPLKNFVLHILQGRSSVQISSVFVYLRKSCHFIYFWRLTWQETEFVVDFFLSFLTL